MIKDITIGYLNFLNKSFLSSVINENNFLNLLSKYTKVVIFNTASTKIIPPEINKTKLDYLLLDFNHFGYNPFIWREKGKLNLAFILIIRTICGWIKELTFIVPLLRKEDVIIAPSRYAKKSFLKITQRFKVHIVPHCLDIIDIQNKISHIKPSSDKKTITYMGRLSKEKGIEALLQCMPRIAKEIKDIQLVVIGPLSCYKINDKITSHFIKLKKMVKKLKLTSFVSFKGLQLGLSKYRILAQSHLFINPSLNPSETFSVANIEALACGLPVVCSPCKAFKEIIQEGKNGFCFDFTYDNQGRIKIKEDSLLDLIKKVFKDRALYNKLRKQAKKSSLRYDYRKIMPRLIRLLKKNKNFKVSKNRWHLIKGKRIIDFKNFYQKDMLFFIISSGWANITYAYLDKIIKDKIIKSAPYPSLRSFKSVKFNMQLKRKINKGLFYYLSNNI
jgi:glycosyltransferase involved in cell wall biosynthesis